MEQLIISDFLSINDAMIDLKRINVFIGPQAKGKSVIAKLAYFFKELPYELAQSGVSAMGKREFDAAMLAKFEAIFPRYAWEGKEFVVYYESKYFTASVYTEVVGSRTKLKIGTDAFSATLRATRKICRKSGGEDEEFSRPYALAAEMRAAVMSTLFKSESRRLEDVLYIPAGRSFFANLQRNIFSFISTSAPIDYFLKEFGALYERTRDNPGLSHNLRNSKIRPKSVSKLVEDLICGRYVFDKDQDWIVGTGGKVSVANSSSGQQEALPLALVLSSWPYIIGKQLFRSFVIEEPEAHLFPVAQNQMISLIAAAYNYGSADSSYIVTTHSPYILSSLNNLIQAGNVRSKFGVSGARERELYSVVPRELVVNYPDVAAYYVDGGLVRPILNDSMQLIDADAIDGVSGFIAERFEKLIEMEFSDD